MACKFQEYPKGLIHWKGEQLLDVIYSTQLFVHGDSFSVDRHVGIGTRIDLTLFRQNLSLSC